MSPGTIVHSHQPKDEPLVDKNGIKNEQEGKVILIELSLYKRNLTLSPSPISFEDHFPSRTGAGSETRLGSLGQVQYSHPEL